MVPTTLLLASLAFPQGTDTLSSTAAANRELVIGVDAFRYGVLYWDAIPQPVEEEAEPVRQGPARKLDGRSARCRDESQPVRRQPHD